MASKHFNQLSTAESERLAILSEELGEAQQAVGKILRHGYESYNPTEVDGPDNRTSLARELGDILHAIERMTASGDISRKSIERRSVEKAEKIKPYLHHQPTTP